MRKLALVVGMIVLATSCYKATDFDFDHDKKADQVWLDGASGTWYRADVDQSVVVIAQDPAVVLYAPTPSPVVGDYDGDGRSEPASVVRTGGVWSATWTTHGAAGTISFAPPAAAPGYETDNRFAIEPVPGRYDGGKTLPAWYRDFDGMWFIEGHDPIQFGSGPTSVVHPAGPDATDFVPGIDQDVPVPADYDGDGETDLAVYGPASGVWKIRSSKTGAITTTTLGGPGRLPAPADYDGTGHALVAVYDTIRVGTAGTWQIDGRAPVTFGVGAAVPTPADYDGDGKADLSYADNFENNPGRSGWHISGRPASVAIAEGATPAELAPGLHASLPRLTLLYRDACVLFSPSRQVC